MLTPLGDDDPREIGPYRIQNLIGRGGMGAVYLGFSPADKAVAVKVPSSSLARDDEFRARFRREVAAARRVHGAAVAAVLDADTDSERPWMATEYVDGRSLAEAVAERGHLDERLATALAIGLAEALVAIHDAGVVHRDLKPANIMLAWDGPRVIDFGVASATGSTRHTSTGTLVGTIVWMAPEQLRGERAAPAADIFAWGACVAFGATGQPPFRAATPEAVGVKILSQPPELGGVPAALLPAVRAALEKDPARRPSAVELRDRLMRGGAVEDALGAATTTARSDDPYATAIAQLWNVPGTPPDGAAARRRADLPAVPPAPYPTATPAPHGTPPSRPGPRPVPAGYPPARAPYGEPSRAGAAYRDPGPSGADWQSAGPYGAPYGTGLPPAGGAPTPPRPARHPVRNALLAVVAVVVLGGAVGAAVLFARGDSGSAGAAGTTPATTASVPTGTDETAGTPSTAPQAVLGPQDLTAAIAKKTNRYQDFTLDLSTFVRGGAVNVVVGSRQVPTSSTLPDAATSGTVCANVVDEYAFVFDAHEFIGVDFTAPSRRITVVDRSGTGFVLDYATFQADDPDCQPSGSARVRFHWDGRNLTVDPSTPVPDPDPSKDGSRR